MSSARAAARQFAIVVGAIVAVALLWLLRNLFVLVGLAVLLAYALDPPVSLLERIPFGPRRMPRGLAAGIVVLALVLVVGWLLVLGVPRLFGEIGHFLERAPEMTGTLLQNIRSWAYVRGLDPYVDPMTDDLRTRAPDLIRSAGATVAKWMWPVLGGLGQLFGFVLAPLLAFYLLAESDDVRASALRFIPARAHGQIPRVEMALDRALRSYVRGQGTVCLVMGSVVGVALALFGMPFALLLGVIVAVGEVLPFIGALIATASIALAGLTVSPNLAMTGLVTYLLINWAIGAFVTPRLIGHHLKLHPFVVTVSVLAGASLLGAAGAMLALPGAAAIQALVEEFTRPVKKIETPPG